MIDPLPPCDIDAEEALLGACLIDDEAIWEVRDLPAADFFREAHGWVWEAICRLADRVAAVNAVTVAYELGPERLEAVGGPGFLSRLVADVPTSAHVHAFAKIVRDTAKRRRLISQLAKLTQLAYESKDPDKVLQEALGRLTQAHTPAGALLSLGEYLEADEDHFAAFEEDPRSQVGLLSGLGDLDRITGGFDPGDLIILAARPSMGKTQMAITLAVNATRAYQGSPVEERPHALLFSLEMTNRQIVHRILGAWAGLDLATLEQRGWAEGERERWLAAKEKAAARGIFLDPSRGLTTADVRARLMRHTARYPGCAQLVIVDYLDLLQDAGDSEVQRRGVICNQLKQIAGQFGLPVLLLCQLNRGVESREDKRPTLADLRNSGEIEQVADTVIGLYRPGYYDPAADPTDLQALVLKNRNGGRVGAAGLHYDLARGRITGRIREVL